MSKSYVIGERSVVLVAHEPPGTEHLGVRLVAAALVEAGFRPHIVPLLSPVGLADAVKETLAQRPFLVGVSLSDPLVAPLMLAFAHLLRMQGYRGHVTVGGALATLQRAELLADHAAIDSVVRHAGEVAIAELARALVDGRGLEEVPGLTTRTSEGRGNPQAFISTRLRPLRPTKMPAIIGIPRAEIAASRGCAGQCTYCGVSALQRDLVSEHRKLGLPHAHSRGNIRRPVDDVADEVAELYHDRGVRIGHFVDDNLLGPDPDAALAWLTDFERALAQRRVGQMAWRLMMDPRAITDAVADVLARMGFLSVLVGFESLTPRGLASLGRAGAPDANLAALDRLWSRGIAPVINVLALRPGDSLADTRAEIAALDRIDRFAWDAIPLTVWPGTQLAQDLAARGELVGKGSGLAWRPAQPEAERFLFALGRLRVGGLAWLMRAPNPIEAGFALRAAHRLGLSGASRERIEQAETCLAQAQQERRHILAQALDIAESPLSPSELGQAIETLAQRTAQTLAPFDRQLAHLLDEISWPSTIAETVRPSRRLIPRWFAGTVFMAMTATCSRSGLHSGTSPGADAALPTISDAAIGPPDTMRDAVLSPDLQRGDASPAVDALANMDGVGSGTFDGLCDLEKAGASVAAAVQSERCDVVPTKDYASDAVVVDGEGRFVELLNVVSGTPALTGAARQAWLNSVANDRWPCLAGQTVYFSCMMLLY
jgi:radical SAM superfamily enzyme YgiQ (UPF0313 family)